MSYTIKKNTITLTRGDTFKCQVALTDAEGNPYEPTEGDVIRFAVKRSCNDPDRELLINKEIDLETMILTLDPEDTKTMDFGEYVYDMQLTMNSGEVDTFITASPFILAEEVY